MANLSMGDGVRNVAYFVMLSLIALTFFYFGKDNFKSEVNETNLEVVTTDSAVAVKITTYTENKQEKLNEKLDNLKDPIVTDGYVSAEFMRIVRSEKSDAEQRGDETSIIRTLTHSGWDWPGEK